MLSDGSIWHFCGFTLLEVSAQVCLIAFGSVFIGLFLCIILFCVIESLCPALILSWQCVLFVLLPYILCVRLASGSLFVGVGIGLVLCVVTPKSSQQTFLLLGLV